MSIATNYFENLCLNPLRGLPANAPAQVYVALFLTNPGETGAGTEVTGGGYARQPVTFSAPAETSAGVQSISNIASIVFPTASAAWGTITYVALMDSISAGNMLHYIQLSTPKEGLQSSTISFVAGELRIDATGQFTTYYKTAALNLLRGNSIAAIAQTYLSLHTADPGEAGSFSGEVIAATYTRKAAAWGTPAEQGTGNMTMTNSGEIAFPQVGSTAWGSISYFGVCDASSGGNMILRAAASPVINFVDGDRMTVTAGTFTIFAA